MGHTSPLAWWKSGAQSQGQPLFLWHLARDLPCYRPLRASEGSIACLTKSHHPIPGYSPTSFLPATAAHSLMTLSLFWVPAQLSVKSFCEPPHMCQRSSTVNTSNHIHGKSFLLLTYFLTKHSLLVAGTPQSFKASLHGAWSKDREGVSSIYGQPELLSSC